MSSTTTPVRKFPQGFVWGVATASYQIEGAVNADGRGISIWDTFSRQPGAVRNGDTGEVACDHYHRMDEDLDTMKTLGIGSYRFSVAWPRIQPDGKGPANQAGLDFYRRLVDGLLARSIEPTLTLYHWDLPRALEDHGGWQERDTTDRFAEYADLVACALGADVKRWITLNEPWCSAWLGYGSGQHAPGIAETGAAAAASHHLLLAHGKGLSVLREVLPNAQVGITLNLGVHRPGTDNDLDVAAALRVDGNRNRMYLDPIFRSAYPTDVIEHYEGYSPGFSVIQDGDLEIISKPLDFLGVNYYTPATIMDETREVEARVMGYEVPLVQQFPDLRALDVKTPGKDTTSMGWEVDASGLTELLVRVMREYTQLPLFVTENGAAFDDYVDPNGEILDSDRVAYLKAHIGAVQDAIRDGVTVRGYFLWSLLDNFEWALGYSRRFGIVWVDFPTGARLLKESFHWYANTVRSNTLG
ncbi:MAG: GH1 family beta-glucosidase [Acidimicrobiales bacterium]